jgi:hypothetical protein
MESLENSKNASIRISDVLQSPNKEIHACDNSNDSLHGIITVLTPRPVVDILTI